MRGDRNDDFFYIYQLGGGEVLGGEGGSTTKLNFFYM